MSSGKDRNQACMCGSGRKFKKCCLNKPPEPKPPETEEQKQERLKRQKEAKKKFQMFMALTAGLTAPPI